MDFDFGAIFEGILAFLQKIADLISGLFGGGSFDLSNLFGGLQ